MTNRSRDNQGKLLPKTLTPSSNQHSFFFNGYDIPSMTTGDFAYTLGKQHEIFKELI